VMQPAAPAGIGGSRISKPTAAGPKLVMTFDGDGKTETVMVSRFHDKNAGPSKGRNAHFSRADRVIAQG